MDYKNLAISILLLFAIGYIYDKIKTNIDKDDKGEDLDIIKKYLFNEHEDTKIDNIMQAHKPILWIHIEYNKNSRIWQSFSSRNSFELNQDYLYLTLRSIINKCGSDFHIVLIDDDSFSKLLDNWNINLDIISNPQKQYLRLLGITKLLSVYGGLTIEPSFIVFKSLINIYSKAISENTMCIAEFPNTSVNADVLNYMPSTKFMGCNKNCKLMLEFSKYLEVLFSKDYTNSINAEDLINKWLYDKVLTNSIKYIDGKYIGTKDINNKNILIQDLIGNSYLELHDNTYALYIPREELLKRTAYNWFVYLNSEDVLLSSTNIGKYLLLSNSKMQ